MICKVVLSPSAKKDFKKLDGSLKKLVLKKLTQLEDNPNLGQRLGNKAGMNLSGFYKLYVNDRKIRIVYKKKDEKLIVKVVTIGKRGDLEVYKMAVRRSKEIINESIVRYK